jgi:hypothetical protein
MVKYPLRCLLLYKNKSHFHQKFQSHGIFKHRTIGINTPDLNIGFFSFRYFPTPEIVPPVPTPTIKWVILPSVCSQMVLSTHSVQ